MNERLQKKIEDIVTSPTKKTHVFTQGNFTVVVIMDSLKIHPVAVGVAKRNPNCDEFNAERGREIALAQAAKSLLPKKHERREK